MCLIVAKPRGVPMPGRKKLKSWFVSHPNGFGLAYLQDNRVRIVKGAMDTKSMSSLIKRVNRSLGQASLDDLDVILHFRQATDGQVKPANCHPFPITSNPLALSALDLETDVALVHNGIIWDYSTYYKKEWTHPITDKTDTQAFIEEYLVGIGGSIWNPSVQDLIQAYTESKFALLSKRGITYIGDFIEDNGIKYSNGGYKVAKVTPIITYPAQANKYPIYEGDYGEDERYRGEESALNPTMICEFCDQPTHELYCPPKSESLVCEGCFITLEGRKPQPEDVGYYY